MSGVVVNEKKGGSALVEFEDKASARMAANIETGFLECPFKVKPLFDDTPAAADTARATSLPAKGRTGSRSQRCITQICTVPISAGMPVPGNKNAFRCGSG